MSDHVFNCIERSPMVLTRAKGAYVWDTNDTKYLDLNAGQFCAVLGHTPKSIQKVAARQLKSIAHTSTRTITPAVQQAAEAIWSICPEMKPQSLFLSTGSEAIEAALRYAKHLTGKSEMICFDNGYHGLSLGSQSVTYGGAWATPMVAGVHSITAPIFHELSPGAAKKETTQKLNELEQLLINHADTIAGLIMEPIISVGGMNFLSKEYCQGIARLCRKYGVLLLYDECQTGVGRTGTWFAYQQLGVVPDILITAKALGAGFPVSLVAFAQSVIDQADITINHFSSHQNDPLPCAVVVAVVAEIQQKKLLARVTRIGAYFLDQLEQLSTRNPLLRYPRGQGLMLGFDLHQDGLTSYRELGAQFGAQLTKAGMLLQSTSQGKTYRILPSYYLTKREIDWSIKTLESALRHLAK